MKTIVGLFDDMEQAKSAALSLERMGVAHNDISLVANNENGRYAPTGAATTGTTTAGTGAPAVTGHAIGHDAVVGAEIGGVAGLLIGLTGLAIPGLGWIAGAGWLMGLVAGAGTGAVIGGLVGALTHVGVPHEDASYYNEGVRRGGILVAVKAQDDQAQQVAQVLSQGGAVNIEERAAQYRREGFVVPAAPAGGNYGTTGTSGTTTVYGTSGAVGTVENAVPGNRVPGIQTGGYDADGSPDTRGITEKFSDAVTGDRIDDKTGKPI